MSRVEESLIQRRIRSTVNKLRVNPSYEICSQSHKRTFKAVYPHFFLKQRSHGPYKLISYESSREDSEK